MLISGGKMTKALQLARSFHAAGHRVDARGVAKYRLTGHRFSGRSTAFHTVPEPDDPGYAAALLDIVRHEGVDVYVPVCSPAASWYDALAARRLLPYCEVVHVDAAHDRGGSTTRPRSPRPRRRSASRCRTPIAITDPAQVASTSTSPRRPRYILKSIPYDPVEPAGPHAAAAAPRPRRRRRSPAPSRSRADNPWILQEFVAGQEYCTHSTVRDGRLQVYAAVLVGVPAQLRDGRQARDRGVGRGGSSRRWG